VLGQFETKFIRNNNLSMILYLLVFINNSCLDIWNIPEANVAANLGIDQSQSIQDLLVQNRYWLVISTDKTLAANCGDEKKLTITVFKYKIKVSLNFYFLLNVYNYHGLFGYLVRNLPKSTLQRAFHLKKKQN
jgi:hypothetical protein